MRTVDDKLKDLAERISSSVQGLNNTTFGRAWKFRQVENKKTVIHPAVIRKKDYLIVRPDDKKKAVLFFYVKGKAEPVNYDPSSFNTYSYNVDLVCWFNSKKMAEDWKGLEAMLYDIRKQIQNTSVEILSISYEVEQIYEGFTLDEAVRQYFSHPYYGAKIGLKIAVLEDGCP